MFHEVDPLLDRAHPVEVLVEPLAVGRAEVAAEVAGFFAHKVEHAPVDGACLGRAGSVSDRSRVRARLPVRHHRRPAAEHAVEHQSRVRFVRQRRVGGAERILRLVTTQPDFERRQERLIADCLSRRLIDRHARDQFAVHLPHHLRAGEVHQRAVLVPVQPFAAAVVTQARQDEQVVFGELQRAEDGRQLAERADFLRLPRFEDGAAGDGEHAEPQRRLRGRAGLRRRRAVRGRGEPSRPRLRGGTRVGSVA